MDKGKSLAIIEISDYLEKMQNTFSGSSKFTEAFVAKAKKLNFIVNVENILQFFLSIQKTLKLFQKLFIKVWNQDALGLEFFMAFVKSPSSWLITVNLLELLC